MGRLSLLQGIFLTQESNRGLLHCRWILYQLSYQGSPKRDPEERTSGSYKVLLNLQSTCNLFPTLYTFFFCLLRLEISYTMTSEDTSSLVTPIILHKFHHKQLYDSIQISFTFHLELTYRNHINFVEILGGREEEEKADTRTLCNEFIDEK